MTRIKSLLPDRALKGFDKDFKPANFLFKQNCFLKTYTINGFMPGNIINSCCAAFNINQRLILVTLQREMGLISKTSIDQVKNYTRPNGEIMNPLEWACGCGVPDSVASIKKYQGFTKQINGAAATYRLWFDAYRPGINKELLDKEIKSCEPETAITYSILMYTPHLDSLTLTEKLYVQYFPEILK